MIEVPGTWHLVTIPKFLAFGIGLGTRNLRGLEGLLLGLFSIPIKVFGVGRGLWNWD